jgi:hypothetical protein
MNNFSSVFDDGIEKKKIQLNGEQQGRLNAD